MNLVCVGRVCKYMGYFYNAEYVISKCFLFNPGMIMVYCYWKSFLLPYYCAMCLQ